MNIYRHIVSLILIVFLIGCGEGNNSSNIYISPDGKIKKAVISQENILKFAQAVHYIEKLDINLNVDSYSADGRTIKNHINKNTGLGYVEFNYKDFKERLSDNIVNGTTKITIVTLNKITGIAKIEGKFDLKLTTYDNNISLYTEISSKVNVIEDEYSKMIIHKYKIYDQKNNEHIEILDMEDGVKGKLFVKSIGYVEFENTYSDYKLFGDQSTEVIFTYKNRGKIDVKFNNTEIDNLYYVEHHVTKYEPPKFKSLHDYEEIDYNFDELSIHYELDNINTTNITVNIDWFVNDKKVKTPVMYELPKKYYQENDKIKVLLTAIHGDMTTRKEIIIDNNYYNTQTQTTYTDEIDITYISNELEFELDIFGQSYFDNVDINKTIFSWKIEKNTYNTLQTINNTQYQTIPTIKSENFYGRNYSIYLKMYENHEIKILKINLKIEIGHFEYKTYNHFNNDIDISFLPKFIDMNNDGLKDIVYNYLQKSDYSEKLMIRFQDRNGNFDTYEVHDLVNFGTYKRIVDTHIVDLNNDGLNDIALQVSKGEAYILFQTINGEFELSKVLLPEDKNWKIANIKFEDFNNDGLKDMLVEIYDKENLFDGDRYLQFIYQQQDMSWKEEFVIQNEGHITSLDYKLTDLNNDGLKDMLLTVYSYFTNARYSLKVLYQDTDKQWNKSQVLILDTNKDNSYSSYLYDIDQDGVDEVFINSDIYDYNGSLLEKTSTLPIDFKFSWESAQKGHFNSDGLTDIVLKNGKNKFFLLLTNGVNNFNIKEYEQTDEISRIFVDDLNYDGLEDLIIRTNFFNKNDKLSLYLNEGNQLNLSKEYAHRAFNNINDHSGYWKDVLFGDFNGDGFKDMNIRNENIAFLNTNNIEVKPLNVPSNYSNLNIIVSDFNHDGIDDILKMSRRGYMYIILSKKSKID